MLWGLYTLGLDREADDFFYFLTDLAEQDANLQIMYGIGGERELTEYTLDHLSGYDGARPVRIGNGAWDQRQHDVWGVLLDSVYLHTRSRDRLDERRWPMLVRQVEAAIAHWREPDQGLWEVRGPAQHFTASKVLCWVAADRGAKLAQLRGTPSTRRLGVRSPTRFTLMSAPTPPTTAECSVSTTAPPRWTPRHC
jgi:GH15 family glucan-1,4-alpha-glucosidase